MRWKGGRARTTTAVTAVALFCVVLIASRSAFHTGGTLPVHTAKPGSTGKPMPTQSEINPRAPQPERCSSFRDDKVQHLTKQLTANGFTNVDVAAVDVASAFDLVVPSQTDLTAAIGQTRAHRLARGRRWPLVGGKDRTPSFPFVTGDGFRSVCTVVFDETTVEDAKARRFDGNELLASLTSLPINASVFVKTELLDAFIEAFLDSKLLTTPFVLVTHNSDYSAPWERSNVRAKDGKVSAYAHQRRALLDNPLVVRWYAQNAVVEHPKLIPIPIGIENRYNKFGTHVALYALGAVAAASRPLRERRLSPLVAFSVKTNPRERTAAAAAIARYFGASNGSTATTQLKPAKRGQMSAQALANYITTLLGSAFVVAPKGHGVDTHRLWEALYAGCVPVTSSPSIMFRSPSTTAAVSALAEHHVHISVDAASPFADVTPEALAPWLHKPCAQHDGREALDMDWWAVEVNRDLLRSAPPSPAT